MHQRTCPSLFRINTGAAAHSDTEGCITLACNILSRIAFSSSTKQTGVRRILCRTGLAVPVSTACLMAVKLPKSKSLLANISSYSIIHYLSWSNSVSEIWVFALFKRSIKWGGTFLDTSTCSGPIWVLRIMDHLPVRRFPLRELHR